MAPKWENSSPLPGDDKFGGNYSDVRRSSAATARGSASRTSGPTSTCRCRHGSATAPSRSSTASDRSAMRSATDARGSATTTRAAPPRRLLFRRRGLRCPAFQHLARAGGFCLRRADGGHDCGGVAPIGVRSAGDGRHAQAEHGGQPPAPAAALVISTLPPTIDLVAIQFIPNKTHIQSFF